MANSFEVRPAGEEHLPGILTIYNDAVVNTTAIWNDLLVDLENRRAWWRGRLSRLSRHRGSVGEELAV